MNKATFASAAAVSSIMNQKPATATTTTSQIAVVHLSNSNQPSSASSATSNGKPLGSYTNAGGAAKGVVGSNRNGTGGGPGVPPKPSMVSYRNGIATSEPVKSVTIKVNQSKQQSDQSDKSLTEDDSTESPVPPDARAKQVLKEAVNAVVNSFAKHSQGGYGRGEFG